MEKTSNNFKHVIVVGLGYVGLPIAISAAESGFIVYGYDTDNNKIQNLNTTKTGLFENEVKKINRLQNKGKLHFLNTLPKFNSKTIFIIAVPTPLTSDRKPDLTLLSKACESVAAVISKDSLVINESTSYIGTLRNFIKPLILDKSFGKNLLFAVAPERIDPGNPKWNLKNTPRVVSGLTQQAKREAFKFYSNFCDNVNITDEPEVAEAAKLFENTFRQVNIALVNELSKLAGAMNLSTHEIINAAKTKPFGYMPFYPSIGVGGHCIPIDPSYLEFSAQIIGLRLNFINLANNINLEMPKLVAEKISQKLNNNLQSKKIQIVGIAYKINSSDIREAPALELIKNLRSMGADVIWHDPLVKEYLGELSHELTADVDLGLIVTPHDVIDLTKWQKKEILVFDLSNNSTDYGWPKFI